MKINKKIASAVLGLTLLSSAAFAAQKKIPVTETSTQQKAAIVFNLLTKSAVSKTIEEGDSDAAKAGLQDARMLLQEANTNLKNGQVEAANVKLNKAIRLISKTARSVVTKEHRQARMKKSYSTRRDSVEAILVAYDRVATEKGVNVKDRKIRHDVKGYLDQASRMAGKAQFDQAVELMDKAYFLATKITKELRQGDTLVRELSFANAAEEYHYEVDRNDSHIMFLKLALKEKKPHPSFLVRIKKLRDDATLKRTQADAKAQAGDHTTAIAIISAGTKDLIKAIRMAGIYIPG